MARLGKRNRNFLGSKSHGKGNAKNKRGKGGKGGWGRAGTGKHRWTYITAYEPEFAKHGGHMGFSNPTHKKNKSISLYQIQSLVNQGKIPQKDGKLCFEYGGKVLGGGELSTAVVVRAAAASEKAIERIKASGGIFEKME